MGEELKTLVEQLRENRDLSDDNLKILIETPQYGGELFVVADGVRREWYGEDVYIRGLIELTNYCKNDCYYCGIRAGNRSAVRYRLSPAEVLECCRNGYALGFRTFVLQGGEDAFYTDAVICQVVSEIRRLYPNCAITLSLGERSRESYKTLFDAGANRYLLRHETANAGHYNKLHPENMSLENRKACLWYLKDIGYEVGTGFMVGSPYQTTENLIEDLRFLQLLEPDMIGIGPYMTHAGTPFKGFKNGDFHLCLRMISILRLMFPRALIPATTALGTADPRGRELGLAAGANVVMPNLSPVGVRKMYEIYENKIHTGEEAAESLMSLKRRVAEAGYSIAENNIGNAKRQTVPSVKECDFTSKLPLEKYPARI